MSYPVRGYVSKPMRCFVKGLDNYKYCKENRRCARCGRDHKYGKCRTGVQPKLCNCGGAHSVAYAGYEVMKRKNRIQKLRVERRITYAEAVRVSQEQNNATNDQGVMGV